MPVTKGQLLSTAAAVRHAKLAPDEVKSVTIDGKAVDANEAEQELAAFEKAIDDAEKLAKGGAPPPEPPRSTNVFARATRFVTDNVVKPTASWTMDNVVNPTMDNVVKPTATWTMDNVARPTGNWVKENAPAVADATVAAVDTTTGIALSRPEDLDRKAVVKIETKDGRAIEIPVLVRDELVSNIMKYTSAGVGAAGLIPWFGNMIQGGTGLVAAVASGTSYMFGDKELGAALFGMAKKHFVMGLVGFVPGVGTVTGIQVANDTKRLAESNVKVGEIVAP